MYYFVYNEDTKENLVRFDTEAEVDKYVQRESLCIERGNFICVFSEKVEVTIPSIFYLNKRYTIGKDSITAYRFTDCPFDHPDRGDAEISRDRAILSKYGSKMRKSCRRI